MKLWSGVLSYRPKLHTFHVDFTYFFTTEAKVATA